MMIGGIMSRDVELKNCYTIFQRGQFTDCDISVHQQHNWNDVRIISCVAVSNVCQMYDEI